MTHPKSLEEFIFNEVCRISTNELASHKSPTVFEAGTLASKATAAEILRVAEEFSEEINRKMIVERTPYNLAYRSCAQNFYLFLESYINPAVPTRNDKEGKNEE